MFSEVRVEATRFLMTQPVKPDHHLYYILLIKLITMLSLGSSGTCLSMEEIQRVRGPLYYASF